MAKRRNAPKRPTWKTRAVDAGFELAATFPNPDPDGPCERCRIAHRRVRFSVSLPEAEDIVIALKASGVTKLAAYFEAHLTIAKRSNSSDSYE